MKDTLEQVCESMLKEYDASAPSTKPQIQECDRYVSVIQNFLFNLKRNQADDTTLNSVEAILQKAALDIKNILGA